MNRSERRKIERDNRLDEKRNKIVLTKRELEAIKQKERQIAQNDMIKFFVSCIPLAEHRVHGFGKIRASRTLDYILNDMMDKIIHDECTIDDYAEQTKKELGINIVF